MVGVVVASYAVPSDSTDVAGPVNTVVPSIDACQPFEMAVGRIAHITHAQHVLAVREFVLQLEPHIQFRLSAFKVLNCFILY